MKRRNKKKAGKPRGAQTSESEEMRAAEEDGAPSSTATAEDETAELRERLQRTVAELQNYRKQSEKRLKSQLDFARSDMIRELLPIVDNFGAALVALEQGQDPQNVVVGVRMIHEMLHKFLADHRVEPIPAEGEAFDPEIHEAVSQEESTEHEPNRIIREVQRGYRMGDLVVRPPRVVVSTPPRETDGDRNDEPTPDASDDEAARNGEEKA